MKIEEFLNLEFSHLETKLYKKVLSFKDFNSKNEKKILENFCSSIKLLSRKKEIVEKMRWIESNLDRYKDAVKEHNPKEYIRIYFTQSEEVYKNESAIYLALKIYNKNEYSVEVNKVVYGLSNDNMGLNGKSHF
jgi:CRISPR-associated protein Csh1